MVTALLSAITLLELELGVQIERRDAIQGKLPVDSEVAIRCAQLHVPDPRSERDALIAATAFAHDLTVATRNVSDFANLGVRLFNPWVD